MIQAPLCLYAQKFDAIGKSKPLTISGGVSTNQIAYFASGITDRRSPYNFFVSGNLNIDLYGWSVPLGFTYSNQSKGAFQQPFNQYGLTPTYKWITGHVGYSSMSFSNYTMSGHLFLGVGADLAPSGPFKVSLMYGRLQKEVIVDGDLTSGIEPAYRRMGYGIKASYAKNKDNFDLIIFKAKDNIGSNPSMPVNGSVTPQDNLVVGLNTTKALFKKILLNAEFAASALTRNQTAARDSTGSNKVPNLGFLLRSNSSTAFYTAYKLGLAYTEKKYTVGLGYERIAPEYKTLGAYYAANDFENITANVTTRLLKEKLSLAVNAGVQHDDLRKSKQSSMKRFVGALNATYQASKKLNFNGSYSNFQSFVNIRSNFNQVNALTPYDNLDTLNYTQITQNINVSSTYSLSQSKEKNQVITTNVSFMTSADKQGGNVQQSGGQFYNINASYSLGLVPKNISFTAGINANKNSVGAIRTSTFGPTIGINKAFFDKKLRSSFSASLNRSYANGAVNSSIINFRLTNSYVVKKKHNLNLSMVALNRASVATSQSASSKSFSEFTTTLGYNYNF
ncbi:hypothetical protein DHW03_02195 [Pedobacter yonginense]|uniref:Outer membrane protein beta-barrel domain-containing protein n=1 Tax=Pedobacter yonginense TaxID=651869 RepID=A0A317ES32_9SPHI|nr:hypothetical protein DHW03_02195 [Pedobacter yonginense]